MKVAMVILSSVSILMLLSTLICGVWLRTQGATPDGVAFHIKIASATVVLVLVCLVSLIVMAVRAQ